MEEASSNQCNDDIAKVVQKFVHRMTNVDKSIKLFVPVAIDAHKEQVISAALSIKKFFDYAIANPEEFPSSIEEGKKQMSLSLELDQLLKERGADLSNDEIVREHEAFSAYKEAQRIYNSNENSDLIETLNHALFMNLYSIFDAFTGELLETIYKVKPELYGSLEKNVPFEEILRANDLESLKTKILQSDIESFRRSSYVEQFKTLEKRFAIRTLREFDLWQSFVSFSQKRNVLMHCDGIVSEQYISVCKENGVNEKKIPDIGEKISLHSSQVLVASYTICLTGCMLAYTLWNKITPKDRETIDDQLNILCFDFLVEEKWNHSVRLGEFIHQNLKPASAVSQKMNSVNLAIGYKQLEQKKPFKKIMDSVDWSILSLDFKLAQSVLNDDYESAASIMRRIGQKGDYVDRQAYHNWPLFKDFRKSSEFAGAYIEIFGEHYICEQINNASNDTSIDDKPKDDESKVDKNACDTGELQ
ncbi:hypothetical protein [Vibrio coralliilyticus]|uniref:hypothetical protein n=1 Tax=Vibrio coralliilyticus TaxID=190893 RepID=UPI00031955E6|nr:hypothetical protein [Vibrio coralliilyticus]